MDCTYYSSSSQGAPAMNILFAPLPAGTTVQSWQTATKNANPTAVSVPGIGDGALYFTTKVANASTGMNFISNGFACNMYTAYFSADQTHLAALAESILED